VETHPNQTRTEKPSQKTSWPRQYLVIVLVALGISLLFSPPTFRTERATGATTAEGLPEIKTDSRLTIKLAQTLGEGNFQVAVKDMKTGETYRFGKEKTFDAASTMKLLFAAYLYHQVDAGEFDINEQVTIPVKDFDRYGTGTIQYQKEAWHGTWGDLAHLMMEQSDNTAAHQIAEKLGHENLQRFADDHGMGHTTVEDNTTTPDDMVKLLEDIYRDKVAGKEQTAALLGILDDSAFEDRLPAQLPEGTKVYHKTGDAFGGGLHDVGLVEYKGHTYAVAIFTDRQGGDQANTKSRMAEASRDIFAYFNRN
jgi:beta-lactamase class A